jgi:hypothetical protein
MKSKVSSIRWLATCLTGAVFATSLAVSVLAQGTATAPPAGSPTDINPRAADRARQLAEGRLRSAEMDAVVETENEKHVQAALVHLKEDFTRIQILRNDIARGLVAHKPLDYGVISEQAGEINKRANRLNVYMLARSAENKESNTSTELQSNEMIAALVRLCKLVDSFTENPALKNAATIDVNDVQKARENKANADRDLLAIIKLSETIKKRSDKHKSPE